MYSNFIFSEAIIQTLSKNVLYQFIPKGIEIKNKGLPHTQQWTKE